MRPTDIKKSINFRYQNECSQLSYPPKEYSNNTDKDSYFTVSYDSLHSLPNMPNSDSEL